MKRRNGWLIRLLGLNVETPSQGKKGRKKSRRVQPGFPPRREPISAKWLPIDYEKSYDFYFRIPAGLGTDTRELKNGSSMLTLRKCKLVGISSPALDRYREANMITPSGSISGNHWLVLKQSDGRLAYIDRSYLYYFEESMEVVVEA